MAQCPPKYATVAAPRNFMIQEINLITKIVFVFIKEKKEVILQISLAFKSCGLGENGFR